MEGSEQRRTLGEPARELVAGLASRVADAIIGFPFTSVSDKANMAREVAVILNRWADDFGGRVDNA